MIETCKPTTVAQLIQILQDREIWDGRQPSISTLYRHARKQHSAYWRTVRESAEANKKTDPVIANDDAAGRWMLAVLCGTQLPQKTTEEDKGAPINTECLFRYVRDGNFSQRRTALCILAHLRGIEKRLIINLVGISEDTYTRYLTLFAARDEKQLFTRTRKSSTDFVGRQSKILALLHQPPASHGVNRTSWNLETLRQVLAKDGIQLSKSTISKAIRQTGFKSRKARAKLTSNDPEYREKVSRITDILKSLRPNDRFFSVDEFGPFAIKARGGRSLVPDGVVKTIPQNQKSRGSLIVTGALELCTNQITYFYSRKKDTDEMIKLLGFLLEEYHDCERIYFSWDAASWHASVKLNKTVEEFNSAEYKNRNPGPRVELAPLPVGAQFLNVIESIFSGMARAIIHNSDYGSVMEAVIAIDRYFEERNAYFRENPKRAGNKIWGSERVVPQFSEANTCKDPKFR